eukprot:5179509-Prymnesium_polylepis.1
MSPIKRLVKKYKCHRNYPKNLHDKVLKLGTTENKWAGGRPGEFSPSCWDSMVKIIRDARPTKKRATAKKIFASMKKIRKSKKTPSKSTIQRAKAWFGFKTHKVKTKPKLSANLWAQRLAMAEERVCDDEDAYIGDEKWCSEEKGTQLEYEARDDSPVDASVKFKEKDMTSLVGTMKHVSTPSQKIVIRHTLSRPCRGRVAS